MLVQVISINEKKQTAKIHYLGWNAKYDESFEYVLQTRITVPIPLPPHAGPFLPSHGTRARPSRYNGILETNDAGVELMTALVVARDYEKAKVACAGLPCRTF